MTLPEARRVFADLMQQAREGKLTEHARARLAQARQILRRAKRPAMNPRPPFIKKPFQGGFVVRSYYGRVTAGKGTLLGGVRVHESSRFKTFRAANFWLQTIVDGNIDAGRDVETADVIESAKPPEIDNPENRTRRNPEDHCPTCGGTKYAPFRTYDERGRVVQGCVDDFHTGHLTTPSESARWHGRPEARKIRARLKKGRSGKGYSSNPRMVRIGRAVEVRYRRDIGRKPGYYKHEIRSRKAGVYTIPPGWVYVGSKSILITEREPRV